MASSVEVELQYRQYPLPYDLSDEESLSFDVNGDGMEVKELERLLADDTESDSEEATGAASPAPIAATNRSDREGPVRLTRIVSQDMDDTSSHWSASSQDQYFQDDAALMETLAIDQLFQAIHDDSDHDDMEGDHDILAQTDRERNASFNREDDEELLMLSMLLQQPDDATTETSAAGAPAAPMASVTLAAPADLFRTESPVSVASSLSSYPFSASSADSSQASDSIISLSMQQFLLALESQLDETVLDLRMTMQKDDQADRLREDAQQERAVRVIQQFWRRVLVRAASSKGPRFPENHVETYKIDDSLEQVATRIQAAWRSLVDRRRTRLMLQAVQQELTDSSSLTRSSAPVTFLHDLSADMNYSETKEAARLIQTILRRYRSKLKSPSRHSVEEHGSPATKVALTPPRSNSRSRAESLTSTPPRDSPARQLLKTMLASTRVADFLRQTATARDEKCETREAAMRKAATKIQSAVRSCRARQLSNNLTRLKRERSAVSVLVRTWRTHTANRRHDVSNAAAVVLQSNFRRFLIRRKWIQRRTSIIALQRFARGYLTCIETKREAEVQKLAAMSADSIALWWRQCSVKNRDRATQDAAITIQIAYRSHHIRLHEARRQSSAVQRIQSTWRAKQAAKLERMRHQAQAMESRSIVTIQSIFRRYHARGTFVGLKDLRMEMAAVVIERFWRNGIIRYRCRAWRTAAIRIQACWRSHRLRCRYMKYLCMVVKLQARQRSYTCRRQLVKKEFSSIKVQCLARQYLARKRFRYALDAAATMQEPLPAETADRRNTRVLLSGATRYFERSWLNNKVDDDRSIVVGCPSITNRQRMNSNNPQMRFACLSYQDSILHKSCTVIQATWRKALTYQKFLLLRKSFVKFQSVFREFATQQQLIRSANDTFILVASNKQSISSTGVTISDTNGIYEKSVALKRSCLEWGCSHPNAFLEVAQQKHSNLQHHSRQTAACLVIQKGFGRYRGRRIRVERNSEVVSACVCIQRCVRKYIRLRQLSKEQHLIDSSVSIIVNAFKYSAERSSHRARTSAAIIIQRNFRCALALRRYLLTKEVKVMAALRLQKLARAFLIKGNLTRVATAEAPQLPLAVSLQSICDNWRGKGLIKIEWMDELFSEQKLIEENETRRLDMCRRLQRNIRTFLIRRAKERRRRISAKNAIYLIEHAWLAYKDRKGQQALDGTIAQAQICPLQQKSAVPEYVTIDHDFDSLSLSGTLDAKELSDMKVETVAHAFGLPMAFISLSVLCILCTAWRMSLTARNISMMLPRPKSTMDSSGHDLSDLAHRKGSNQRDESVMDSLDHDFALLTKDSFHLDEPFMDAQNHVVTNAIDRKSSFQWDDETGLQCNPALNGEVHSQGSWSIYLTKEEMKAIEEEVAIAFDSDSRMSSHVSDTRFAELTTFLNGSQNVDFHLVDSDSRASNECPHGNPPTYEPDHMKELFEPTLIGTVGPSEDDTRSEHAQGTLPVHATIQLDTPGGNLLILGEKCPTSSIENKGLRCDEEAKNCDTEQTPHNQERKEPQECVRMSNSKLGAYNQLEDYGRCDFTSDYGVDGDDALSANGALTKEFLDTGDDQSGKEDEWIRLESLLNTHDVTDFYDGQTVLLNIENSAEKHTSDNHASAYGIEKSNDPSIDEFVRPFADPSTSINLPVKAKEFSVVQTHVFIFPFAELWTINLENLFHDQVDIDCSGTYVRRPERLWELWTVDLEQIFEAEQFFSEGEATKGTKIEEIFEIDPHLEEIKWMVQSVVERTDRYISAIHQAQYLDQ